MKPPMFTRKGNKLHFPRLPRFDAWLERNEWGILVGTLLVSVPLVIFLIVLKLKGVW